MVRRPDCQKLADNEKTYVVPVACYALKLTGQNISDVARPERVEWWVVLHMLLASHWMLGFIELVGGPTNGSK
jgi:hypothetical protein